LTEEAIVATALQIIEERGVDGLTMRYLSERLGVALGATYRHVPNKHALLRLVSHDLSKRVDAAVTTEPDGLGKTRSLLIAFRDIISRYPGMASYIADHLGELAFPELLNDITDDLLTAGLSQDGARLATLTLFFYTAGAMLTSLPGETAKQASESFAAGLDIVLRGIHAEVDPKLRRRPRRTASR
jgi:AcrR family transcriptional regulator